MENLIDIQTRTKSKGFHKLTLNSKDVDYILPFIGLIGDLGVFSQNEKSIIEKIINSYEKVKRNLELQREDFILSEHEISEFKNIKKHDLLRFLVYRYKYNKYPELKLYDEYPPCVQIEPASICNYRCIMCYQIDKSFSKKSSAHMGYMTLELYKNIIDQIEGKVEAVTLASRGEPLLNKDIIKMIEYTSNKFLGFKLNTNASLLTEDKCHAILSNMETGTIVFSADAASKELYEKIRKRGNFEKIVENIANFKKIKETHYPSSKIITRVSGVKLNSMQNVEDMEKYWFQHVDQTGFTNYTPWHSSYTNTANNVIEPCTELWRRIFVWQDGTVNPCDYDYKSTLSVGKVQDNSISEIWQSTAYEKLRKIHLSEKRCQISPCLQCPMV
jgi:radical SAM protein with 4Fe4S-binding SPASM domain